MASTNSYRPLTATAIGVLSVFASAVATAQVQSPSEGLQEIVVTAQKRSENLQTVPVSISAFSADEIAVRSVQNVGELLNYAPNVTRASGPSTGDDGFFFFRGLGQVDNSANVEPGVGVYVDDVYLGRVQGASFDVMDIDRIEILRGPQGTLFGRNTIGGAVSAHTRDPGKTFAGQARVTLGERNRTDAQLSLDIPFNDQAGMLFSVFSRNQNGWAKNVRNGDRYGDRKDTGGRVKFVWKPSDRWEVKLSGDYNRGTGTVLPTVLLATLPAQLPIGPGGSLVPFFGSPLGVPFPSDTNSEIDTTPHDGNVNGSINPDLDSTRSGLSLQLAWDTGPFTIKSITAYRATDQTAQTDLDGTSYSFYDFTFGVDQHQISQEFQFFGDANNGRIKWLGGLYYYKESLLNATLAGVGTNTGGGFLPPPGPGAPPIPFFNPARRLDGRALKFQSNLHQDTKSYAAFAQLDFALTDRLGAIVGLRYTKDEKDMLLDNASDNRDGVFSPLCVIPFPPGSRICAAPGGFFYTASFRAGSESQISGLKTSFNNSWSQTSPKFGVNFQLNSATLLYASWSKGFKSGGFQGRATPGNTTPAFDPETVKTTEVGFKSEFADHKVRLNAAAFFTKYTGAQILISQIVNGTPQFVTANAGDSDIKGIELELVARPAPGFDVNASLGWIDNHYTRLNPGAAAFNIGLEDSLPNTPKYTFALGTQYRWAVGTGGSILVRGDYSWRDDQSFQAANNPNDIQKAYGLLDLRATWLSANSTLSVSAFLRNALNEGYFTSLSDQRFGGSLGVSLATLGLPREYGVEFGYRF